MINRHLKVGDIVWIYNRSYGITVEKVKITSALINDGDVRYYEFNSIDSVGSSYVQYENVFETEKEARDYAESIKEQKCQKMIENIKGIEDVIRLAYDNMFSEEYTNWEAIEVVKLKAKELLGIELK